jgi:hypothetical protein
MLLAILCTPCFSLTLSFNAATVERERERTLTRPPPRYLIGCLSRVAAVHDGAATMAEVGHVTKEDLEICAPQK